MKKAFSPQSHYYVFALLFAIMVTMGGVFYDDIKNIGVRAAAVDVNCSGTASSPTSVTEADLASDDVTFKDAGGDGWCELDESISATSVLIEAGVTLTHVGEDADGIDITTTGNFEIESGAYIDVSAKGCAYDGVTPYNGSGPDGSNVCYMDTTSPYDEYPGAGQGGGSSYGYQGAGYGGSGGLGTLTTSDDGGKTYGSATAPTLFGSSGGGYGTNAYGGSGGGLVRLDVSGTFTHNGAISADGGGGQSYTSGAGGGGSGGAIYITASAIAGTTGTFSADGGDGGASTTDDAGGGGGAGRIAVIYDSATFSFDVTDFSVAAGAGGVFDTYEGEDGIDGTVYVRDMNGDDALDADDDVTIYSGFTYTDTDYSVNSWTFDDEADNQYCDREMLTSATPSITTATAMTFDGSLTCAPDAGEIVSFTFTPTSSTLTITNTQDYDDSINIQGALNLSGTNVTINSNVALTSTNDMAISASSDFNLTGNPVSITVSDTDEDLEFTIPASDSVTWTNTTFNLPPEGEFLIDDAISIELAGTTTINGSVNWTNLTALTIGSSAAIYADAKGCAYDGVTPYNGSGPDGSNVCYMDTTSPYDEYPGAGQGGGSSYGYQGAGYGGSGGLGTLTTSDDGGKTYGSATAPTLFGSSGGGYSTTAHAPGGTGGGLVRLDVSGTLTHNGTISADGGTGGVYSTTAAGGGGSGGAIYITASAIAGTTGTFSADGGSGGATSGGNDAGGGGGAGRIAVIYDSATFSFDVTDFSATGGAGGVDGSYEGEDGDDGTVYVRDMNGDDALDADDDVTIYSGFTYTDTDYSVNSWTFDDEALNQYCDREMLTSATPSITTATAMTFDGSLTCAPDAGEIVSFTFTPTSSTLTITNTQDYDDSINIQGALTLSGTNVTINSNVALTSTNDMSVTASTDFNLTGNPVSITVSDTDEDLEFTIPTSDSVTWTNSTINVPAEGEFLIDDAISIELAGTTTINGSVNWTNLTTLTIGSSAAIYADAKGCAYDGVSPYNGSGPDGSNICTITTAGYGEGGGSGYGYQGAGYGGSGGAGTAGSSYEDGGLTYGSATAPTLFGSSGGGYSTTAHAPGGTGGGLVRLDVSGTLTHNGTISADGGTGGVYLTTAAGGGGSGGAIYITADAIAGTTGTFSADGGSGGATSGGNDAGGGGGGGRIAIIYDSATFSFGASDFSAAAGAGGVDGIYEGVDGDDGTVYVRDMNGDGALDADDDVEIFYGFTYTDTDYSVNSWTFDSGAGNQYCDRDMLTSATPSITVAGNLIFDGSLTCAPTAGAITSFTFSPTGNLTINNASVTPYDDSINIDGALTLTTTGNLALTDDAALTSSGDMSLVAGTNFYLTGSDVSITVSDIDSDLDMTIPSTQTWNDLTVDVAGEGTFTIDDTVSISMTGTTAINASVDWTNLTALSIGSSASINADERGCQVQGTFIDGYSPNASNVCGLAESYSGGWGDGYGSRSVQGAGHGGAGGVGNDSTYNAGGKTYGSATAPVLFGSSGGSASSTTSRGGNGGGLVRLDVSGTLTHDGTISADAGDGASGGATIAGGGGSGGSVYITTGTITGAGTFSADGGDGGNGDSEDGGGGGGGRMAIIYDNGSGYTFNSTNLTASKGLAGAGSGNEEDGGDGTVYVNDNNGTTGTSTDDVVQIFYGFTYADTDYNVTSWAFDAGADNQYCDRGLSTGATPSVTTSSALTFDGALDCTPDAGSVTSFNWSSSSGLTVNSSASMTVAGDMNLSPSGGNLVVDTSASVSATAGALTLSPSSGDLDINASASVSSSGTLTIGSTTDVDIGSGVTLETTGTNSDLAMTIPNSDDQVWTNVTMNVGGEGESIIDDTISIELAGTTTINGSVDWTNLTALTIGSSSSINADERGCQSQGNFQDGYGPDDDGGDAGICHQGDSGFGDGYGSRSVQGAGHAGAGGVGNDTIYNAGGKTYGSSTAPVLFGSSGGGAGVSTRRGGHGGGLVRLDVSGTFSHSGTISADGGDGLSDGATYAGGGGSGGSIYVTTGTLTGAGTFTADGGDGAEAATEDGGGGGAGRIAIIYDNGSGYTFNSTNLTANKGLAGVGSAAVDGTDGTVYVNDNNSTTGTSTDDAIQIFYGFTYADTDYNVSSWAFDADADNQHCDRLLGTGATPSVTTSSALTFDGTLDCTPDGGSITSFNWSSGGNFTFNNSSSIAISGSASFASTSGAMSVGDGASVVSIGDMVLSDTTSFSLGSGATLSTTGVDSDIDITAPNDQTWTNATINVGAEGELLIDDNISIELAGTTAVNGSVNWSDLIDLTIGSSASINAAARGCRGGITADGYGPDDDAQETNRCDEMDSGWGDGYNGNSVQGAGYGGAGGLGSDIARDDGGLTYGSLTSPTLFGSGGGGGGTTANGGYGGGLVQLTVNGTLTHNGVISADGGDGGTNGSTYNGGGGSGGSIFINVNEYTCTTGTLSADGGDGGAGSTEGGGGGGGGRISALYTTDSSGGGCPLSGLSASSVATKGLKGYSTAQDGVDGTFNTEAVVCGDGDEEGVEECDDGGTTGGDGCDENCRDEVCGNGWVQTAAGEGCDDGGTTAGDGCSDLCAVEIGYMCSGEPSVCTEDNSDSIGIPTTTTVSNSSPVFTTPPADDSDGSSPTNIDSDVTFTGAATDLNGDQYYLAICKTDAVSVGDNAAPTCTGDEWAISAATNSGSAPTVSPTYTVTSSETSETYDWFAFVCDKKVSANSPACYPGNGSGDQGSAVGTITLSDIPVDGATVTIDSVAYEFDDNSSFTGTQVDISASQTAAEAAQELVDVEAGSSSFMVRRGAVIYAYANTEGVGGNSIAMSESGDTGDDIALSGSTLSGGSDTGKSPFVVNHGPTFGSVTVTDATEMLTNGTMETGDPPSSWTITADATATSVADERTGGSGSSSMEVTKDVNTWVARQDVTTVIGDTYRVSAWLKNVDADSVRVLATNSNNTLVLSSDTITATSWTYTAFNFVAEDTTTRIWLAVGNDSGDTARFDDISVVAVNIEPGDNLRFILPSSEIADGDTEGGQDTINMYICTSATTGFDYSANTCTGGTQICSVTGIDPTAVDAVCDETGNALVPVPTAHGSYNFKVYVEDENSVAATSGTNQQSYTVEDVLPVFVSYSTIDSLSIAAGGSDTLTYSVSLTDDNGDNDVTDLSMTFFDSDEVNSDCNTDENDCYFENIAGNCGWTNKGSGTDNALGADCDFTIYFNANAGSNWEVSAEVVDGNGTTDLGASTAQDFEIISLQGIDVVQGTIAYSTIQIGGTSAPIEASVGNVGNTDIDILIHGADMVCQTSTTCGTSTIGQEQQRWHSASNTFDWDDSETGDGPYILDATSGTGGGGAGCIDHDLRKRDSYTNTSINQSVYWKLRIPGSQPSGNYQGSNTFTSTAGCDAEICNNTSDDDGDGRADCADHHDCDLSPLCAVMDLPMGTAQHDTSNDRTLDTSPNANHATFGDGQTSTTYPTKLSPMVGYELDGGDYFDAGDVFTTNQTEFTASAWVYVDAFNTHVSTNIRTPFISSWNTWSPGSQEGFILSVYYSQATDVMSWQFNIADGTDYYTTATAATNATTFNSTYAGRWLHVLATYKAGEYMRLYLDGTRLTNKTADLPAQMDPDTASTTWIGRTGLNPGYLDGKVAEVKIFDYVFDDTQAENLYLEHMSRFK